MQRYLPLLAVALVVAAGCDSSGPERDLGRSTLTVTGSFTDQFTGSAGFSVVTDAEGRTGFVVMLYDGDMSDEESITRVATFVREGPRPAAGTFAIGEDAVVAFFASEITAEESVIIGGEEGELVITSSSASLVKGTFSFTGVPMGLEEPAVVSGTFEAPSFPMIGL